MQRLDALYRHLGGASKCGSILKCLKEQIVVQLRGMHLMIVAILKSEYGQVVVKTQTNT